MVARTFDPSTQKAKSGEYEFETSLVYRESQDSHG